MLNKESEEGSEKKLMIKNEYKLWRKNCCYMYEFIKESDLPSPSLTVQWLPKDDTSENECSSKLILGTYTLNNDQNYLKFMSMKMLQKNEESEEKKDNINNKSLKCIKKFKNNGEINRARYLPQTPKIVATINGFGDVDIYDLTTEDESSILHRSLHEQNGFGISWNQHIKGYLLTGADDKKVVLSDIKSNKINVISEICSHSDIVNDVKWSTFNQNLFATVSDDKTLLLFDIRTNNNVSSYYDQLSKGINLLSFSPFSHNLIATGDTNSNISLLDLRKLSDNRKSDSGLLHVMMGHSESITSLEFSNHNDGIIASSSQDRRLIIWDLSKIGEEQQQEDSEDGCPELFMMHAGHTGSVMDLSWCPYKSWTLASVADDNVLHMWEVNKSLVGSNVLDTEDLILK